MGAPPDDLTRSAAGAPRLVGALIRTAVTASRPELASRLWSALPALGALALRFARGMGARVALNSPTLVPPPRRDAGRSTARRGGPGRACQRRDLRSAPASTAAAQRAGGPVCLLPGSLGRRDRCVNRPQPRASAPSPSRHDAPARSPSADVRGGRHVTACPAQVPPPGPATVAVGRAWQRGRRRRGGPCAAGGGWPPCPPAVVVLSGVMTPSPPMWFCPGGSAPSR